jgi:hypothetical protein
MNREQAIRAVADKIGLSGPFTNNLVDAMEAVGVLKLEKPVEPAGLVCTASRRQAGRTLRLRPAGRHG